MAKLRMSMYFLQQRPKRYRAAAHQLPATASSRSSLRNLRVISHTSKAGVNRRCAKPLLHFLFFFLFFDLFRLFITPAYIIHSRILCCLVCCRLLV
jgi:hypothetical protein